MINHLEDQINPKTLVRGYVELHAYVLLVMNVLVMTLGWRCCLVAFDIWRYGQTDI